MLHTKMLHTKFRGNRFIFSREADLWAWRPSYVTQMPQTNFRSPNPRRLLIKFGFDWASGFGEEDV